MARKGLDGYKFCPKCGELTPDPDNTWFRCDYCGSPLSTKCTNENCLHLNDSGVEECVVCGSPTEFAEDS